MAEPYWSDGQVSLYVGDCREILPALGVTADCIVADPPYGETPQPWDRWPDGWIDVATGVTRSLWCFGSLRMFLAHATEFAGWKLSQDVIWEKHGGSGFATDRFKRVHEHVLHWYRGPWGGIRHEVPRVPAEFDAKGRTTSACSGNRVAHAGSIGPVTYTDDGLRLMRSVIRVKSVRGTGRHPAEKPAGILTPLITYACPPGGLVVDLFAGSGSTLAVARDAGRRAIGIEADERYAELAARRLSQADLFGAAS